MICRNHGQNRRDGWEELDRVRREYERMRPFLDIATSMQPLMEAATAAHKLHEFFDRQLSGRGVSQEISTVSLSIQHNTKVVVDAMSQLVGRLLKEIRPKEQSSIVEYVSNRETWIYAGRSNRAPRIAKAHPNQVVTKVGEAGEWIRVRYFDYLNGAALEGWARKKYFKRIDRSLNRQNCDRHQDVLRRVWTCSAATME
ncbi:MAG: hypothetical protein HY315_02980 [Acidobacteria bacterium]|nr:hypothetical protein [Acidobacteriota bacterium]